VGDAAAGSPRPRPAPPQRRAGSEGLAQRQCTRLLAAKGLVQPPQVHGHEQQVQHQHRQQLCEGTVGDEGGVRGQRQQAQPAHVAADEGGQRQTGRNPTQRLGRERGKERCRQQWHRDQGSVGAHGDTTL